jgi:hypothetical protein
MPSRRKVLGCPGPCGRTHDAACRAATSRPALYSFFSAAFDGCELCVREALQAGHVKVNERSDVKGYTVLSWALWGQSQGHDTAGVQRLLLEHGAVSLSGKGKSATPKQTAGAARLGTGAFEPRFRVPASRQSGPYDYGASCCTTEDSCDLRYDMIYDFLAAAFTGCLPVVRYYVEVAKMDVDICLPCANGTPLAWAMVGECFFYHRTQEVQKYLLVRGAEECAVDSVYYVRAQRAAEAVPHP